MTTKAILWDFGDTLVDEKWMQAPLEGHSDWSEAWRRLMYHDPIADDWNLGRIDMVEVSRALGQEIGALPKTILDHMIKCSHNIGFFARVMDYARSCPLPQAIVTVNPDIFSYVVAPHYQLLETFPILVTSWEELSLSKVDMGDKALSLLDSSIERKDALLIDNKQDNTREWEEAGGQSYQFVGEEAFCQDIHSIVK